MGALLLLALLQATPDQLIQALASEDPEVRLSAEAELLRAGAKALPALRPAACAGGTEVGIRARACLERIEFRLELTPRLVAVSGLEGRLLNGDGLAWHREFMDAVRPGRPVPPYEHLDRQDLSSLARGALKRSTDPGQRTTLVYHAGHSRLEGLRPELESLLRHERVDHRCAAAWAIMMLRGPRVLEEADRLLKDPDPKIRAQTFVGLCQSGVRDAIPRLLEVPPDATLGEREREDLLLRLGAKIPTPALERTSDDPSMDYHVRNMAAMHLAYFRGPEIIPHMRRLLRWCREDPNTADYALLHLSRWGDQESIPRILAMIQTERLWGDNPASASRALLHLGAESSAPALLTMAADGNGLAIHLLARIGKKEVIPSLRNTLARPSPAAIVSLAELGDRESAPAFRNLLGHSEISVRRAAATALAILKDSESAWLLRDLKEESILARKIWPDLGGDVVPDALANRDPWSPFQVPSVLAPMGRSEQNAMGQRAVTLGARAWVIAGSVASPESLLPDLLCGWGRDPNPLAAAALVRLGRREGLGPLLETGKSVFSLNRLRKPELFKRLDRTPAPSRLYATFEAIHRSLAAEASLRVDGLPGTSDEHRAWAHVHEVFEKWGAPPSVALGFEMMDDERWGVVLEDDRIRVLPREEAVNFWKDWSRLTEK